MKALTIETEARRQCNLATQASQRGLSRHLAAFRKDEDGSMVILTLFIFIFMLVMAGLGIDSMRHEMNRANLQATLDSAVLAGAGSSSEEAAKSIVEDYFEKAGMSQYLNEIGEDDIVMTLNSASVTASAEMQIDTYLMKLSGIETLDTNAKATAQTRIPKLEIALVLDVSNSMNQDGTNGESKIDNLQTAAKQFVTTILNSTDPGNATISIVPFSTSVAPSEEIFDALLVDETHTYSNCLVFDDDDYNDTALVTDSAAQNDLTLVPMKQAIYTSRYGNFDALNQSWRSCYTEDGYRIMQFSTSETALHTKIDNMIADGNTTGSLGVKWGAALLDPTFRDVTGTTVPVDYSDPDTMKVIVMMGDGQNTTTLFFADDSDYRGPDSDLFHIEYQDEVLDYVYYRYNSNYRWYGPSYEWVCPYYDYICVYEPSGVVESAYFMRDPDSVWEDGEDTVPDQSVLDACREGTHGNEQECKQAEDAALDDWWYYNIDDGYWVNGTDFVALDDTMPGFQSQERFSWEEAWGLMSPDEYGDITGIYAADDEYVDSHNVDGAKKDIRMNSVCTAAKNKGVVIYTIGYEITEGGTAESSLKRCASGYDEALDASAYYYRVDGIDITDAFGSIAGNVQSLRLTQ